MVWKRDPCHHRPCRLELHQLNSNSVYRADPVAILPPTPRRAMGPTAEASSGPRGKGDRRRQAGCCTSKAKETHVTPWNRSPHNRVMAETPNHPY